MQRGNPVLRASWCAGRGLIVMAGARDGDCRAGIYCSSAYSALASFRIGISGSASFQSASLRVTGNVLKKKFEGNKTFEPRVFGFVDHSHAADTELFQDAVVRNDPADHSSRILRGRNPASQSATGLQAARGRFSVGACSSHRAFRGARGLRRHLDLNNIVLDRVNHQIADGMQAQFPHDIAAMSFHRFGA